MMTKIALSVTSSLPKESKEEFVKRCTANADLFAHFAGVFKRKQEESVASAMKLDKYDKSSWPYYQADQLGYQRAMAEVEALLNFNKD